LDVDLSWTGGDPDGDSVTYDVYFEAGDSTPDVLVSEDQSGTSYDPGTLNPGTHYYWQIVATDEHGATTTGPVWDFTTSSPPNNPPVAVDDSATTDEDIPVDVAVLVNDTDPDGDALAVSDYDSSSTQGGTVNCPAAGVCTYTPPADFNGTDTFSYTASDGRGGTDTAIVTVTVNPINDPPVAVDDLATTDEDTPVVIEVTANDTDVDGTIDPTTVTIVSVPSNGLVTVDAVSGDVTYSPDADYHGTDSFTYTVDDDDGATSNSAMVTVTVGPVNDSPNIPSNPSPADGAANQSLDVDLSWTGGDPDGDSVTYDVYFEAGDSTPDVLVCNDVTSAFCDPGTLNYETHYYWQVVATDEHGATTTGPVWDFHTEPLVGPIAYESHTIDDDTLGQSNGNGNGVINPGETIELYASLANLGTYTATAVTAVLTHTDPYVSAFLYNDSSAYPDIPGGGTEQNIDDWDFEVDPTAPDGHVITFYLNPITADNGGPWVDSFVVTVTKVSVIGAWTADGDWNPKTTFAPGDPIQWVINVENTTGGDAPIELTYDARGPNGEQVVYMAR
jgi:hypothetical protein